MLSRSSGAFALVICLVGCGDDGDGPHPAWARTYGGQENDVLGSMDLAIEGGWIVAGSTASFGAGDLDLLLLELGSGGEIRRKLTYGGAGTDGLQADSSSTIRRAPGGGYLLCGQSSSHGPGIQAWLLRLGASGVVIREKTFIGLGYGIDSVRPTRDGGAIAVGNTSVLAPGSRDALVVKLGEEFDVEWQRACSSGVPGWATHVIETRAGGFLVGGHLTLGDTTPRLIKLSPGGALEWERIYAIAPTPDSSTAAVLRGLLEGRGDSLTIFAEVQGSTGPTFVLLKISGDGSALWQKAYRGPVRPISLSALAGTRDAGYIAAGFAGHLPGGVGALLLKLSEDGALEWARTYGGPNDSVASSVLPAPDGGYIVCGTTNSFGPDRDFWVLEVANDGSIDFSEPAAQSLVPQIDVREAQVTVSSPGLAIVDVSVADLASTTAVLSEPLVEVGEQAP